MDIKEFDSLIEEFKYLADTTKGDLTNMIGLLSEGKIPSDELRQKLGESLGDLQNKYDNIYAELQKYATNVECPDIKGGINLFAETFKRSEELRIRNEVEAAKSTIEKFLRVTSSVDAYLKALKPYQDNARQILDDITANKDNDETDNEIQKEKIFLRALEVEPDSEEVDALFDIIAKHYSSKVQTGLAFKRYFIGDGTTDTEEKNGSQAEPEPEEDNTGKDTEIGQKDDIDDVPCYITAKGKLRSAKPNATAFVNYISGNNAKNAFEKTVANFSRNILRLGIRFSVISKGFVEYDLTASRNREKAHYAINRSLTIISSAFSELMKKGYILEYELPSQEEPLYCLSPLTESCLKKKTVRDLFSGIDWSSCWYYVGRERVPENILKNIYRTNMILFRYISQDNSLWYEDKEMNLGRSVTLIKTSDDENAEICDCRVYDHFDLNIGGQNVNCVLDNGCLPDDLPANNNIFVYDRNYESVLLGNTVYYFDEIKAEDTEDSVNIDEGKETKISSPTSDFEKSTSDTSIPANPKKENAKGTEAEAKLKTKPQPKSKMALATKAAHVETDSNEPAQELPKFICAKSKLKMGKADATQFVKELTRKNAMDLYSCNSVRLKQTIIAFGARYGLFSSEFILQLIISLDRSCEDRMKVTQDVSLALSELLKNGYLIEYALPPKGETIYSLSPLTEACLKKKAAREIEWEKEAPSKLLFVGEDKIHAETINQFMLANKLCACYLDYCYNNNIEVLAVPQRFFDAPIDKKTEISGRVVFDSVNIRVNGKEIMCYIDNGGLSSLDSKNILVVDRNYQTPPSKHKVYYMDELDTNEVKGNAKKEKTDKSDKSSKSKTAMPKPDNLDVPVVNNPVSNILTPIRGEKKQAGPGPKVPVPVGKNPDKAELLPLASQPAEPEQAKTNMAVTIPQRLETVDTVKQDSAPEASDRLEAEVIQEQPSAGHTVTDSFEKLLNGKETPSDEDFYQIILSLLSGKNATVLSSDSCVVQALLMAKAAAGNSKNTKSQRLYEQLLLATRLPLDNLRYASEWLEEVYSDENGTLKSARLASYIHALIRPDRPYDSGLKSKCKNILQNYEEEFPSFPELKQLFSELTLIERVSPSGFSDSVLVNLGDAATKDKYVADLQKTAEAFLQTPQGKVGIRQMSKFYELSMGNNSDIYQAMSTVAENQTDYLDVVKACLKDYCTEEKGKFSIDQDLVDKKINKFWSETIGKDSYTLDFKARSRAENRFKERIELMKNWVEYADSVSGEGLDIDKIRKVRSKIVKAAIEAKTALTGPSDAEKNLLVWVVNSLLEFFNKGNEKDIRAFTELLHTGVISLDDNGIPVIDDNWHQISYYEPWRLVLRHIVSLRNEENKTLDKVKNNIFDNSSPIFDNLQQLKLIGRYTGNEEDVGYALNIRNIKEAKRTGEDRLKKFKATLELYYTFGRITSEEEKETLLEMAEQYRPVFYQNSDFGIWKQFLEALRKRIDEISEAREEDLQNQLQACFDKFANNSDSYDKEPPEILTKTKHLLDVQKDFTLAEDYINKYNNGETELTSEDLDDAQFEPDSFAEFIDDGFIDSVFPEILNYQGDRLAKFAKKYCPKHYPEKWGKSNKQSSEKLINNWPVRSNRTTEEQLVNLFRALGFNVSSANRNLNFAKDVFELTVVPSDKSKADYTHPIARFGTQVKSPVNVVILFGNLTAKQLVDKITGMNLGDLTIVLVDYFIDKGGRRKIAEEFHKTSGQNSFIFIDWILAVFLALHQESERLPVLLKCSLPYTNYQPFVSGGGATADEMFCGRTAELERLINLNGACVVYGGRQLGKTALLLRTVSRCSKPQNKAYAVYSNINNCKSEKELVTKITADILNNTNLPKLRARSLQELCDDLEKLFKANKILSMHLLMDESDNFLEAISNDNYIALLPLINLRVVTGNSFKFVLAGLHNVCRAKNATKNNGVFGQLGDPLPVRPLSPADALRLLSRPLRYLGFKIARYPHLETILTQTNYYPGILQFYGYKIVEDHIKNYGTYYKDPEGNPPFMLQVDRLGELIISNDLNKSIADKFRLSLELDERYFMIARCIALLHYEQDEKKMNWMGYKVGDIISCAREFKIQCLADLQQDEYKLLLDEMVDMGILNSPDVDCYRLRRYSFIKLIGPNYDAVFEEICNKNGGMAE